MAISKALRAKIRRVKLVVMDNDGVLTDGRIVLGEDGRELKFFDVQDGLGLVLLRQAGLATVVLSSRRSRANRRRAEELGLSGLYENIKDKLKAYERLRQKFKLRDDQICGIGDDLPDLPVLNRVGFSVAVANAVGEIKRAADYVTQKPGGQGAVREVAELLLKTQNRWRRV